MLRALAFFLALACLLAFVGEAQQREDREGLKAPALPRPVSRAFTPHSSSPTGFRLALPGYQYAFPRDHGAHPAYATEWWYYTGHLKSRSGREFGFQATWFRTALAPAVHRQSKWATRDIFFAHFALTDISKGKFLFSDRIGRGVLGLSGASVNTSSPRVHVGAWNLAFGPERGDTQSIELSGTSDGSATRGQSFGARLKFRALKAPTIHGENGVSQKSAGAGRASHYYSFCSLATNGSVELNGETFSVTGQSWFDHEFGSSQLERDQTGWDWFSIQLDDGRELMLYHLRKTGGRVEPLSSGTLVERDGRTRHLQLSDFRLTPLSFSTVSSGARYPTSWRVEVPSQKLSLVATPQVEDQELRPLRSGVGLAYWEGAMRFAGTSGARTITGQGYLELTGYAKPFAGTF